MDDLLTLEEIETAVKAAGYSLADVSDISGVNQSIFSRWRNRKTEPSARNYRRIAAAARALAPDLRGPTLTRRPFRQFRRVEDGRIA
jgi:transcriptional regulator with XRE-family HTH domain